MRSREKLAQQGVGVGGHGSEHVTLARSEWKGWEERPWRERSATKTRAAGPSRAFRHRRARARQRSSRPRSPSRSTTRTLFFEYTTRDAVSLEEGMVKTGARAVEQGVGVRAQAGERQGYAHADEITLESVKLAASTARAIAEGSGQRARGRAAPARAAGLRPVPAARSRRPPCRSTRRCVCCRRSTRYARARDPRIAQVMASVALRRAPPDDRGERRRPGSPTCSRWCVLRVQVIAVSGARRETGSQGTGGRIAYARLGDPETWKPLVDEAVRIALTNLEAVELSRRARWTSCSAPAGRASCCTRPSATGSRATSTARRRRRSPDRLGQRVASPGVTVVDDGTLPGRRGSLNVDDEGTPTEPHRADRGRHPARLPAGPPERAADGHEADRQRPARELPAPAHAAHDQHLHARRPGRSRRTSCARSRTASTRCRSAADRSTSPAASSCSRPARPTGSRTARSARR